MLATAAMVVALAVPAAAQGPPQSGSGEGTITALEITSSRFAGPNEIQERKLEAKLVDGPLQGTFVEETRGVIRPNGKVTFQGVMEFTGELYGCGDEPLEGTLTARFAGTAVAGDPESGTPVTAEAKFRVVNQASNTIPVSAQGTFTQTGPVFSYTVQFVCR
jgi:hypothetical protein